MPMGVSKTQALPSSVTTKCQDRCSPLEAVAKEHEVGARLGSLRDMEAGEEAQAMDISTMEQKATAPEPPAIEEPPSPPGEDVSPPTVPAPLESPEDPEDVEEQELEMRPQDEEGEEKKEEAAMASPWSGPEELELALQNGQRCVRARLSLTEGLSWGPFHGSLQTRALSPEQEEPGPAVTLQVDESCWLRVLPQALTEAEANSEIYRKDDALWCRVTKAVPSGGLLRALLVTEPHSPPRLPVQEPVDPGGSAPVHTDIQLLPQQAGMASILATAVINKDVFPCKDCGIWYRSERNLQAHLLYYCASRQRAGSPVSAAEEKPKESYPNERVCPFPQCRKSCPSASSLEIHMRSHSGERPFVCLICLSAFTTKANCERHLKVHTDTLSGVCHNCGFISTTRDILYSHLVTSHMVCQPGSKGEIYAPGAGHPAAKLPPDSLAGFQQHSLMHSPLAPADKVPTPSSGLDSKALAEVTNGETRVSPQNGGSSDSPAAPKTIKVEAAEEPEATRASGPGEPGPQAPSRTPSPHSPTPVRVKAELSSPTPGSSPGPGELTVAGTLFLPQYVFGPDAGTTTIPAAPQASDILAKMSEMVQGRLQQGVGSPAAAGTPTGLFAGTKGATCFECEITFNNINNYYVHKRLYCSGRRAPEDPPAARRPKAATGPARAPPGAAAEPDPPRSPPGPGPREEEASGATTPEAEAAGRGSEGSQSPSSSVDDAEDDPSRTLCEACNIRFSRHETYIVHKRYYCASRHDPPPRRPPAPTPAAGAAAPALTAPPVRTRRRRKLYELPAAGAPPPAAGPAPVPAVPAPAAELPSPPRPASASAGPAPTPSPSPAPDGPIDLSKRPRRQTPDTPAVLPALADYHECTACRVSFHSLEAYLAHKKYSCPSAPLRTAALCPYCPPNGRVRGDLVEHLRQAHGLQVTKPAASSGAEPRTPAERAPRDSPDGRAPRSPSPSPSPAPENTPSDPVDQGARAPCKGQSAPTLAPAGGGGGHRYCRLCNIRFSSLSTFIAHKKYYCSSHAAEHVK
ncbi:zinc finger protein ZFPM1 isoform X1 [Meriones unguiculatus]|uniref:zinc finger protein ZFPM1 isoform X1 n=2 Tax=Meriones unguiculatus TaxID=10047 RepID=UPI00293E1DE5|nr:zinc finger protein ZFPM1 isoform X1 [Meriones unguiculatus]